MLKHSSFLNEIQQLEVNCVDYSKIWIKISKEYCGKAVVRGLVHSPPEGSPYCDMLLR